MVQKLRASRNQTVTLSAAEKRRFGKSLKRLTAPVSVGGARDSIFCQDLFEALDYLPPASVDLVFADPPYNLGESFNGRKTAKMNPEEHEAWLESWISRLPRLMKPTGSVYICGEWRSSSAIHRVASRHFRVRNRVTWEREKGRGAKTNWKSVSEDIWFCTVSNDYVFNVDAVKLKRRVIAPYKDGAGKPKDWTDSDNGRFRATHPSNLWTDLTAPFWSMPENTDHPTQKPEKLLAKIILASSNEGDLVFDPFLGSGTTAVAAAKLNRRYVGVEIDKTYCLLAAKRLEAARSDPAIQGYHDGVFWERNAMNARKKR